MAKLRLKMVGFILYVCKWDVQVIIAVIIVEYTLKMCAWTEPYMLFYSGHYNDINAIDWPH